MAKDDIKEAEKTAPAPPEPKELSKDEKKAEKKSRDDEFNSASTIHVKLYSPYKVYYDDEAESVSAENATGPFDVLARHHNFITLLKACEVDIKSAKGGDKIIKISRGVMHVHRNKVTIFLDV